MPVLASRSRLAGVEDHAAARGHDDAVERRELGDDLALALTKPGFAFLLEDVADVDAGALLDLGVAVDERLAEQRGEPPADGGLSRPHRPDQIDVTLAQHGSLGY